MAKGEAGLGGVVCRGRVGRRRSHGSHAPVGMTIDDVARRRGSCEDDVWGAVEKVWRVLWRGGGAV